jgi:hypothetical protein
MMPRMVVCGWRCSSASSASLSVLRGRRETLRVAQAEWCDSVTLLRLGLNKKAGLPVLGLRMSDVSQESWVHGEDHDSAWKQSFWGGDHGRRAHSRAPDRFAQPRADWVVLGPKGAGKTSILAGLRASCERCDTRSGSGLRVVPLGLADLEAREAPNLRRRLPTTPTATAGLYSFQSELVGSPLAGEAADLDVVVRDVPGTWAFPEDGWPDGDRLRATVVGTSALLLVADASAPNPEIWERGLPHLLSELAFPGSHLVPRADTVLRNGSYPKRHELRMRWPFERVLVVLSKIDALVESAVRSTYSEWSRARSSDDALLSRVAHLSPLELAEDLSPVEQVEETIGNQLNALRAVMPTGARLAVGLTSAWGIDQAETGQSVTTAASDAPAWQPYGLQEVLLFLVHGRVQFPVVELDHEVARSSSKSAAWIETNPDSSSFRGGRFP